MDLTPDSLARLPAPVFYRSKAPYSLSSPENTSSQVQVEVLGSADAGQAQWGLLVESLVPDTKALRPTSFLDLLGDHHVMRRGHAWRSITQQGDSLLETRYVPVFLSDLKRLANSETPRLAVNTYQGQSLKKFDANNRDWAQSVPDSLSSNATAVDSIFTAYYNPDTAPSVEGGLQAVQGATNYPQSARSQGIEGVIFVQFIVDKEGTPTHVQIMRGTHPLLDKEALRAVQRLEFTPGLYQNQPVPVLMSMPFSFYAD